MGTGRKFRKTHMTRPTKSAGARRTRQKAQSLRLIALGVAADVVAKMNPKEIRDMLKYPKKIKVAE